MAVRLRLPTYFCAPNFAYLMVADAYDAVSAVPGVRRADVRLDDHFAADQINAGVAARAGFAASFGALAAGELDELRADFVRKAVLAGTDRVGRPLVRSGHTPEQLAVLTLGDVPPGPDLERLRARRAELDLPAGRRGAVAGRPGERGRDRRRRRPPLHLGRARLTRISAEANTGICRGMLRHRYATSGAGERATRRTPR